MLCRLNKPASLIINARDRPAGCLYQEFVQPKCKRVDDRLLLSTCCSCGARNMKSFSLQCVPLQCRGDSRIPSPSANTVHPHRSSKTTSLAAVLDSLDSRVGRSGARQMEVFFSFAAPGDLPSVRRSSRRRIRASLELFAEDGMEEVSPFEGFVWAGGDAPSWGGCGIRDGKGRVVSINDEGTCSMLMRKGQILLRRRSGTKNKHAANMYLCVWYHHFIQPPSKCRRI